MGPQRVPCPTDVAACTLFIQRQGWLAYRDLCCGGNSGSRDPTRGTERSLESGSARPAGLLTPALPARIGARLSTAHVTRPEHFTFLLNRSLPQLRRAPSDPSSGPRRSGLCPRLLRHAHAKSMCLLIPTRRLSSIGAAGLRRARGCADPHGAGPSVTATPSLKGRPIGIGETTSAGGSNPTPTPRQPHATRKSGANQRETSRGESRPKPLELQGSTGFGWVAGEGTFGVHTAEVTGSSPVTPTTGTPAIAGVSPRSAPPRPTPRDPRCGPGAPPAAAGS